MAQDQLIRSLYDAINHHDVEKFTSFFADDGVFKDIATDEVHRGKDQLRAMADKWLKAFPDMKLNVTNVIGNADMFCAELTLVGTHKGTMSGPLGDIPATNKKVQVPSCDVIRMRNGKIQSLNCYFAANLLMSQLGVQPGRAAA